MARVLVERPTPNQQASTSFVVPWRKMHERGQEPVAKHQPMLRASGHSPGPAAVQATTGLPRRTSEAQRVSGRGREGEA